MKTAKIIKNLRSQLGMSQATFAEAVDVECSTVSRWENEKTVPNRISWLAIFDYCEKKGINTSIYQEFIGGIE